MSFPDANKRLHDADTVEPASQKLNPLRHASAHRYGQEVEDHPSPQAPDNLVYFSPKIPVDDDAHVAPAASADHRNRGRSASSRYSVYDT